MSARLVRSAVDAVLRGLTGGRIHIEATEDTPLPASSRALRLQPRPYGMPDTHPLVGKVYA